MPPSRERSSGSHFVTVESIRSHNLRANVIDAETVVTDTVVDRNGNEIVNTDKLVFDEAASLTLPVDYPGTGRVWVRNDVPSKLIFTSDASPQNDIPLRPSLAKVLSTDTDGGNFALTDLGLFTFHASSGVDIGNQTADATASSSSSVAVGQAAETTAASSVAIGNGAATAPASATAVGYNVDIVTVGALVGGVAIGSDISSNGAAICIGKSIVNDCSDASAVAANIFVGRNISFTGAVGSAVAIGDAAVPSAQSVIIGTQAGSLGGTQQVCIGHQASVGSNGSVAAGSGASCQWTGSLTSDGDGVAIGNGATCTANRGVAIGATTSCTGAAGLAVGAYAVSSGATSIAIGGGTAPSDGASATAIGSIAVGNNTLAAHPNARLIGPGIESRVDNEFCGRGFSILRATATTSGSTPLVLLTYPTVLGDVVHADLVTTAYDTTSNQTYVASLTNQHFRHKTAGLTKSAGIGTTLEDNTQTGTYATTITAVDSNITVTVTGGVGETVNWTAILRLYGRALA